jgi:hypothetical protein
VDVRGVQQAPLTVCVCHTCSAEGQGSLAGAVCAGPKFSPPSSSHTRGIVLCEQHCPRQHNCISLAFPLHHHPTCSTMPGMLN